MDSSKLKATTQTYSVLRHVRWEHLLAGVCGGVAATLTLHPLDLVKIRFQVNEGPGITAASRPQYKGIVHALLSIVRTGGFTGLYKGVTPNVWGAGLSWGIYFFIYNWIKTHMQDGNSKVALSPIKHLAAAGEAGLFTLFLTNPIWVTKTRLCLQYEQSTTKSTVHYRGMMDALLKIYRFEGVRGLYKGFIPGVFGISHGALQFMAYEEMKKRYNMYLDRAHDTLLTTAEYLVFAALSKIFAATVTYPYQVVRSRLQDQHSSYDGIRDCIQRIYRFERLYGFYKGLAPNLLRVTPACCITFVVYEKIISMTIHAEKAKS